MRGIERDGQFGVYILTYSGDFHLSRVLVQSIRHHNPGVPLMIIPGEGFERADHPFDVPVMPAPGGRFGGETRVSILQNVDAEQNVHLVLPESQVLLIDTQPNVIQALESNRADAAAVDLYGAALRQGDLDWLHFVNTTFDVAMFGHVDALYDAAFVDYFGEEIPARQTDFPSI